MNAGLSNKEMLNETLWLQGHTRELIRVAFFNLKCFESAGSPRKTSDDPNSGEKLKLTNRFQPAGRVCCSTRGLVHRRTGTPHNTPDTSLLYLPPDDPCWFKI